MMLRKSEYLQKCNKHSHLLTLLLVLSLAESCAVESAKAELQLKIMPSTTIHVGETLTLDASESVYDLIAWKLDGVIYGPCQTEEVCELTFDQPGFHEMLVEVTMDSKPDVLGVSKTRHSIDEQLLEITVLP
ncbi:MAG: hypothetical protein HQM12_05905 [SAR324 cluster bacterium]|nr:hypothetical protein [SAR324 cluster bacterium]